MALLPPIPHRASLPLLLPLLLLLTLLAPLPLRVDGVIKSCAKLNYCSGHGQCQTRRVTNVSEVGQLCDCFPGYSAFDCSEQKCPQGPAWTDIPNGEGKAHRPEECSAKGLCNRVTGRCACHFGFKGSNCARSSCPTSQETPLKECSGHGQCLSMRTLATRSTALPLNYQGDTHNYRPSSAATTDIKEWDHSSIYGCLCDSSWEVGLGEGETQAAEWFGTDCSQRRCPSGDNPYTLLNEQDCSHANFSSLVNDTLGSEGNLCYVECSNQGLCHYTGPQSGQCACFQGRGGVACEMVSTGSDMTETEFEGTALYNFIEEEVAVEDEKFWGNPGG